jgi:hypothetical protein
MELYHAKYKFTCEWDKNTFFSFIGTLFGLKTKPKKHIVEIVEFETEFMVYEKDENDATKTFMLRSNHWIKDKVPSIAGNWESRPDEYIVTKKEIQVDTVYPGTFIFLRENMIADQFINFIQDVQNGDYK